MDVRSLALAFGRHSAVLEVNKWREAQYLHVAAQSACTASGSHGFGSLALQTPNTAGYKTLHVNLCNKTKCGGGECSSVSVFPHPVLSKESLNIVIFFYFRRIESGLGKHFLFSSRTLFACVSDELG